MLRHLVPFAVLVAFFTVLFAMTTEFPFWLPLCVLSFNWIAAPLIGHWFDTRNPHYDPATSQIEGTNWKMFGLFIAAFAFIGWLLSWQTGLPYFTAFEPSASTKPSSSKSSPCRPPSVSRARSKAATPLAS